MDQDKNTPGVVPLSYVVASVYNRLRLSGTGMYEYYLQIAIDGFTHLNLFVTKTGVKVAYLTPDANGQMTVPPDFIDYVRVMTKKGGRIYTLGANPDYVPVDEEKLCTTSLSSATPENTEGRYPIIPHTHNGQYYGGLYAMGGGFASSYFNFKGRKLRISASIPELIIMEYNSTGISMCGDTLVPRQAVAALREYILWQSIKDDDNQSESKIARKKQEFLEEEAMLVDLETLPKNSQEVLDLLYSTTHLGIKR